MNPLCVNYKNLAVFAIMVLAMAIAFLSGGYASLYPVIFLAGLGVAILIGSYSVLRMDTPSLVVFFIIATIVAVADEYAHTAAGTLAYFDHGVPSLLTVTGWGIFMLVMLSASRLVMKIPSFVPGKTGAEGRWTVRVLPALVPCILIAISIPLLNYGPVVTPLLLGVYILLAACSLYITARQPLTWNLAVLIASLGTGCLMEYFGALEGVWSFHYGEPVSLIILFSWPLRFWTVLCFCHLAGYDIGEESAVTAG